MTLCCSFAQSCPTLCDPMDRSTTGLPVLHHLPEPAEIMSIDSVMPSNHSSSVALFSSCPQSFLVSWFFASGGQSIGASASASILQVNLQDWFPLGCAGLISLQSKGLSRVFSNTTVQKHRFFGAQPSLWFNSHIHTWPLEKPYPWLDTSSLAK